MSRRKPIYSLAAALVLASGVAACGGSSSKPSSGSVWRQQTMAFKFGGPITERRFRVGHKKVNFGDRLVSRFGLLQGKERVGSVMFHCASRDKDSATCAASFSLPGGQVASVTTQRLAGTFPVTGGSGRYMGATGQWSATSSGDVKLRLLLPVTG